jgi:outer membrane receptor protein involved in Fe transport
VPAFARQADLQILASSDAVAGQQTGAVQGVLTVQQGLDRLLAGTNLVVASNDGRTAVLARDTRVAQGDETQDPVSEVDSIVVTGFRASLSSALTTKRRANGVVDVIKAEDMADFPDANLAESIQRVPGVSIARDAGEGRQITVRGLGPQFTRVRINGVEGQSTASGTDSSGGANRNRAFDFNVFASELFNSITVRKTASAETEEGSLGATVDLALLATAIDDPAVLDPESWRDAGGLVTIDGSVLRFPHDVVRVAAHAGLAHHRRRAVHAAVAASLARCCLELPPADDLDEASSSPTTWMSSTA